MMWMSDQTMRDRYAAADRANPASRDVSNAGASLPLRADISRGQNHREEIVKIEDLKDPRDRAACERAQHSTIQKSATASAIMWKAVNWRKSGSEQSEPQRPTLSQIEKRAVPAREHYDDSIEHEFQSGRPRGLTPHDISVWNGSGSGR